MQCKKTIWWRVIAGVIYLALGIVFILISFKIIEFKKILDRLIFVLDKSSIQWCIGWTSVGIGAGLINTRKHLYFNWCLHHIGYYGFVLVTVSLLSFVVAIYQSGESWIFPHNKFYSLSALIGLVGGFLGDIFRPLAISLLNLTKRGSISKAKQE